MRDIAEIIKREVEGRPGSPEAGVAARVNSATDWYAGNWGAIMRSVTVDNFRTFERWGANPQPPA
jgi:hypothetical protein